MIARIRRRLRDQNSEAGMTLVELLVAIMLLTILLALVGSFFIAGTKLVTLTKGNAQGTGVASNAMNEISRVIRSGNDNAVVSQPLADPAFLSATPESITMYSYVDSYVSTTSTDVRPQLVQFSLNASRQLVEKRWLPTSSSGGYFTFPTLAQTATTTPASTRIIADAIAATPTGSAPLFTFNDATGAAMTIPANSSATLRSTIASVTVTVRVNSGSLVARPYVILQNTVRIPNLGFTEDTP